jgi:hypothetical protein
MRYAEWLSTRLAPEQINELTQKATKGISACHLILPAWLHLAHHNRHVHNTNWLPWPPFSAQRQPAHESHQGYQVLMQLVKVT